MNVTIQTQKHFNKVPEDEISAFRIKPRTVRNVLSTNSKIYDRCHFSVLDDCISSYCRIGMDLERHAETLLD
jgi:hypothetical protein